MIYLEMDDYEAANLLWLLQVAQRIGLDTGDWCHQLTERLRMQDILGEPNYDPLMTERWINGKG